ncbi:hypothetical protein R1sor_015574 [Riccia sorocarpa]|uniref:Uncharacterized protein n=1 Tax=Riccia sorocarpa TaxID=122646 RepID=A0ABD3HCM2_9MARC
MAMADLAKVEENRNVRRGKGTWDSGIKVSVSSPTVLKENVYNVLAAREGEEEDLPTTLQSPFKQLQQQEENREKLSETVEDCMIQDNNELGNRQQPLTGVNDTGEDVEMTVTDSQSQKEEIMKQPSNHATKTEDQPQLELFGHGQIGNWDNLVDLDMGDQGLRGIKGRAEANPNYTPDKGNSQKKSDYRKVNWKLFIEK